MDKQHLQAINPQQWLIHVAQLRGEQSSPHLQSAFAFYDDEHQALLQKGLSIANILLSLGLDNETLVVTLLYPALQKHLTDLDGISEDFGEVQRKLLRDVMRMQSLEKIQHAEQRSQHRIENIRKMLLAMVTDVRAVLIILAERLWQLRTAKNLQESEQRKLAQQTLDVYAPLANRLGVWQLKWEIEDYCLRYLQPEVYSKIAKWLSSRRPEREAYLQRVIDDVSDLLKHAHIAHFKITGRIKHIYSIYNKMQRKNNLDEIYDASASRVIVENIDDCYAVLSVLHNNWEHITSEFDDYIARPKANGYQSIHTVLYGPENKIVEVQIRTQQMHEESELGVAAHWQYKEGVLQTAGYDAKIALLRQIMAWQKEVVGHEAKSDKPIEDLFADRVYVFTPNGDVIDMPQGATPLDFAYHVHSEVGHRCRGAKVNGKIVPLTYALKTGERVEILTAKHANPSRDWLNPQYGYLKSPRALAKAQHWFRVQDSVEVPAPEQRRPLEAPVPIVTKISDVKQISDIQVSGVDQLLSHVARCCKPLPGDEIVGYITRARGVSVHRSDCKNVRHIDATNHERLISVNWGDKHAATYSVDLHMRVIDSATVLRDVTTLLANEKISIKSLQTRKLQDSAEAEIYLSIEIADVLQLTRALRLLQQIQNVIEVRRW